MKIKDILNLIRNDDRERIYIFEYNKNDILDSGYKEDIVNSKYVDYEVKSIMAVDGNIAIEI